jgi:putative peptidoglycan lipid II flippase
VIATLQEGAVSYLYYADRIYQLPLGVVGIAIGTALLPTLSRELRSGATAAAIDSQARALEFSLLLTLPAAAALMVIATPVVTVLFERGEFSAAETSATAPALVAFASGLPAYVLVKVLSPGFFAREDAQTPFKVSVVAVITNIGISLALFWQLGHVGIALATALASWLHAALLWSILKRRGFLVLDQRLRSRLPRMAVAAAAMAGALVAAALALEAPLSGAIGARVGALAVLVVVGLAVFAFAAQLIGAANRHELAAMLRRHD